MDVVDQIEVCAVFLFLLREIDYVSYSEMLAIWFLKLLGSCLSLTWFPVSWFFIFIVWAFSSMLAAFVLLVEMILMKIYRRNMQLNWLLNIKSFFQINSTNRYRIQLLSVMCLFANVVEIVIQYLKDFRIRFEKRFWIAILSFLRSLRIPRCSFIRWNIRLFIHWFFNLISFDLAVPVPFVV